MLPAKGPVFSVYCAVLSVMFLMDSGTASEIGQYKREKLTKLSNKMKFDKNDNRIYVSSGPVYFKTNGGNPEELTRAFLKAKMSIYGFDSSLSDIQIIRIDESAGGITVYFRQVIDAIPVYQSNSSITINRESIITWANIFYRPSGKDKNGALNTMGSGIISFIKAQKIARNYLDIKGKNYNEMLPVLQWFDDQQKGMVLTWKVCINADDPDGEWTLFIDAQKGEVLQAADCRVFAKDEAMTLYPEALNTANVIDGTDYDNMEKITAPVLQECGRAILQNTSMEITAEALRGESGIVWKDFSNYWCFSNRATVMDNFLNRPADRKNHRVLSAGQRYPVSMINNEDMNQTGNIISNALICICNAIGRSATDTLLVQAIKQLPSAPTATMAAMAFLDAEYNIYHGQHRIPVLKSFDDYGLIQYVNKIPYDDIDSLGHYDNRKNCFISRSADWLLSDVLNRDNEYFLDISHAASLNISTCSPATNFNTRIAVFRRNRQSPRFFNDDVGCSDNPTSSSLKEVNLPAGEYYVVVGTDSSQIPKDRAEKYGLSIDFSRSLEVYMADWSNNQNDLVKPAFHIVNTGTEQVKDPIVRYYFTVEENKVPTIDDYYTPLCTPYLENYGNGLYCVRIVFSDVTINPEQRFPEYSEIQVGMHYIDRSDWDRSNDFSQPGSIMGLNTKVAVFNKADYQIYGQIPEAD